jgi:hypothetical protein
MTPAPGSVLIKPDATELSIPGIPPVQTSEDVSRAAGRLLAKYTDSDGQHQTPVRAA